MGKKFKYLALILIVFSQNLKSQDNIDFQKTDSITYNFYLKGMWNDLQEAGNEAIGKGLDYKFLRQRLGYAYFAEGDYVRASKHLQKAYDFDSYDPFTLSYLYYSNLYLGKPEVAGLYASHLTPSSQVYYKIEPVKAVENIDFEFSFKIPSTRLRSNPWYYRLGLGSRPFARLGIYQSISAFSQNISVRYPTLYDRFSTRQYEYYLIARYALSRNLTLQGAYHLMYTDYSSSGFYTNIAYAGAVADFNLLRIQADVSFTGNTLGTFRQAGIRAGLRFPGIQNFVLNGGTAIVNNNGSDEIIWNAGAGIKLSRKIYAEGGITSGNMNYYNDYNALYVYNSIDPVSLKTGITINILTEDNLTFWIYTGSESKKYFENEIYKYNQFTFLGGLRWRH